MIRFNIEPQLNFEWRPIVTRQLHLMLSPVLHNVKFGDINLYRQHDQTTDLNYFCCEFQGYGAQNETFYAFTQNTDGRIAIRDALARIRRAIIRKYQHTITRAIVTPISTKQARSSVLSDF